MPSTSWAQKVVPYGADQTVYFVIDRFGKFSSVHRETEVERTDLETLITDLMSGQFNDPIQVVAFNTLEHCRRMSRTMSRSKSRLAATLKASQSPSIYKISLPASPGQPGSWP
jgi:hypothetical protein